MQGVECFCDDTGICQCRSRHRLRQCLLKIEVYCDDMRQQQLHVVRQGKTMAAVVMLGNELYLGKHYRYYVMCDCIKSGQAFLWLYV